MNYAPPPPNKKKKAKCGLYMLEYKTFLKYSTVQRKENPLGSYMRVFTVTIKSN